MAAWALLLAVAPAPFLAHENAWAAWAARREGARRPFGGGGPTQPYPSLLVWCGAWAQEVVASLQTFAWRQPWAHAREVDHLPEQLPNRPPDKLPEDFADPTQPRRGVLLVHGFVCNRGFWNPWMRRLRQAGVPFVAVTLEPPFGDVALQAHGLTRAWGQLMQATGVPPLLVGHSMGGLVIRSWLAQQPDAVALQHEVITIGTPHHGTALAMWAHSTAARQMQLLSPFLMELAQRESAERRSRFTCYWSVCDNIVFPANTATLPGARAVAVPGRPHVALAHDPLILRDVLARTAASIVQG
jgi:pimeloyl-ACP methyl ester carboxylesterase